MWRDDVYDDRRAGRALSLLTARRAGRSGLLWGLLFGATVAATMSQYPSMFPTVAARRDVARSLEPNVGFRAVFGVMHHMDTVAGYTAYKVGYTLLILGAIWGLLTATRVLRGEEDGGRWELLLAGQTTPGRAARQVALGLGVGVVALWVPTAVLSAATGASARVGIAVGSSVFFATAMVSAAAMFVAVGMLASQLAATRHDADLLGAAVMGGSYLVRMAADSDPGLGWLRWLSPFGWVEELRPLTGSKPLAFVPIVVLVAVLITVAVRIAARRDIGASVLGEREAPEPRTLLLGGQAGLTVRLTRTSTIVWTTALAMTGLVFGLVTQAAGRVSKSSPTFERILARLGGTNAGAVAYLGYVFLVAGGLVAIAVAGQVAAMRNEEADGHLDNLLVRPVARWQWLGVRLVVGLVLVVGAGAVVGTAAWVGAISQHTHVGFVSLLEAGLNVVPPAVFVLGVGVLTFGVLPRLAIGVTYGLVVWSFLAETVASVVDANRWIRDTSPFLHITPAPAAPPDWTAAVWLVALGVVLAGLGVAAFARRDLTSA